MANTFPPINDIFDELDRFRDSVAMKARSIMKQVSIVSQILCIRTTSGTLPIIETRIDATITPMAETIGSDNG